MATIRTLYALSVHTVSLVLALFPLVLGRVDIIGMALIYGASYVVLTHITQGKLEPVPIFLYVLAYFGLISEQFALIIPAIIALYGVTKVRLAGDWYRTLVVPWRTMALATAAVFMPFYLLYRAVRDRGLLRLADLAAALLYFMGLLTGAVALDLLRVGILEGAIKPPEWSPLTWIGVIGWEELISRAVGPWGNAMWVLLHTPSRYAAVGAALTFSILILFIHGVRWLQDLYNKGGVVGSIVGHAVYNATVSAYAAAPLLALGVIPLVSLIIYLALRDQ